MNWTEKINESKAYLEAEGIPQCSIGIVLGTGLGDILQHMEIHKTIDYDKIPQLAESTMEFHKGRLLYGTLAQKEMLVFDGRFHKYEGYSAMEITYPIRLLHALGVQHLVISNAAGAVNLNYNKGELMLIDDHINLQGGSPLAYRGNAALGPKFVDMSAPYSIALKEKALQIAQTENLTLHQGVYASVVGPQLETRAEYRYLKIIGADAVGMSTVPEVIAASHMKMPCVAVSVLTDECNPEKLAPFDLNEVIEVAQKAEPLLTQLFSELISRMEV